MRRTATAALPVLFALTIVGIGLVLRGPIIAGAPVISEIRIDLGFTAAQAGLLTSLPVLCFALATPVASVLIARAGPELATTITLLGVVFGAIVRSSGETVETITGTVVMGVFITAGNVVVPVIIRRDVAPTRVRSATALYTSALIVGSVIATLVTAPVAQSAGWRAALALWAGVTVVVLVGWFAVSGRRALLPSRMGSAAVGPSVPRRGMTRAARHGDRVTGTLLCIAFAGQTFAYYGLTAWLPTLLEDELGFDATAAGGSASVFQLAGLIGAVGVPLLARAAGLLPVAITMGALWLAVPVGLMVAPEGWFVWSVLGGAAQGAGITFAFIAVVEIARDDVHARRLSATMQGIGYGLGGATAPIVLGAIHDATDGWQSPLILVVIAVVAFGALSVATVMRVTRAPELPERLGAPESIP